MQTDINSIVNWCKDSQLEIASSKCAVLHLGHGNPNHPFYFGDTRLETVNSIRDLGVTISQDMKFHQHIREITSKACIAANLIHRTFSYRNPQFLTQMFNVFVRSKLEYASQVWNPQYIGDILQLERVQRNFTKRIPGLYNISYTNRLQRLNINTLELRRIHLDLIFTYKVLHNKLQLDSNNLFKYKTSVTRGHRLTLRKPFYNKDIRGHYLSNRIVDLWNALPDYVVSASSISNFKKLLYTDAVTQILCDPMKGFLRGEATKPPT